MTNSIMIIRWKKGKAEQRQSCSPIGGFIYNNNIIRQNLWIHLSNWKGLLNQPQVTSSVNHAKMTKSSNVEVIVFF